MARILIADDSEVLRQQLTSAIGIHPGWTVCGEAANGVSAVLKAHELKPDLVIMDLVMPMLDGLQSSAEIAKLLPTVPIVVYSLHILTELEMEAKKYGVWALVSKTAEQSSLIETMERLLAAAPPQVSPNAIETGVEASPTNSSRSSSGGPLDAEPPPMLAPEPD
jgi:DNA-binding NarL/FixJ family response regulator